MYVYTHIYIYMFMKSGWNEKWKPLSFVKKKDTEGESFTINKELFPQ